ncbi:MAG: hypothetical protein ACI92I_000735 [Acidimicrobiales bacterium]|jgi:hypothetical protein
MEGTKNERVGILVAAYVIGFATAYIAFGVIQLENNAVFVQEPTSVRNTASVIESVAPVMTGVSVNSDGLVYKGADSEVLLSAKSTPDEGEYLPEGSHVKISDYSVSPDGEYVYFCELPSLTAESCVPFLYIVSLDVVYPVTIDEERIAFEAKGHKISWTEDGQIRID